MAVPTAIIMGLIKLIPALVREKENLKKRRDGKEGKGKKGRGREMAKQQEESRRGKTFLRLIPKMAKIVSFSFFWTRFFSEKVFFLSFSLLGSCLGRTDQSVPQIRLRRKRTATTEKEKISTKKN